jgi:hypothetical protein
MDYVLLRDYTPFKKGQIVELPPMTAAKLLAAGVVRENIPAPILKEKKTFTEPPKHKMVTKPEKEKSVVS